MKQFDGMQLEEMRKNEDPRLSFSTPEFKEAQRMFTEGFKVDTTAHFVSFLGNSTQSRVHSTCIMLDWA